MLAVWHWPCALIALLLSGFGGLRSLPADGRTSDEAERVVVSRPAARSDVSATDRRYAIAQPVMAFAGPVAHAAADRGSAHLPTPTWRPAPSRRQGSAGGARAP